MNSNSTNNVSDSPAPASEEQIGGVGRGKLKSPLHQGEHQDFYCFKCETNRRRHRSDKTIKYKEYDIKMKNGKTRKSYMLFSECERCKNSLPKIVTKEVAMQFPKKTEKKEKAPKKATGGSKKKAAASKV